MLSSKQIADAVSKMTKSQRANLLALAMPRIVEPYFQHVPHPTQQVFLSLNSTKEVFFGGAAGGGKSDALLMGALQYVDVPGYSALILRKTWPDLVLKGAIMERTSEWLTGTPAKPHEGGRYWTFPSGARLQFGHLQHDNDKFKYQSAEFQYIAFDELTHWEAEETYTYLFSRLRRPALACLNCGTSIFANVQPDGKILWKHKSLYARKRCRSVRPDPKATNQYPPAEDGTSIFSVPLRMRSASNPGGRGGEWVERRFVNPLTRVKGALFVPSKLTDNPSLDQESYLEALSHLSPLDQMRLIEGDWSAREVGDMFDRSDFEYIDKAPSDLSYVTRFWDLAATESTTSDWTSGTLAGTTPQGDFVILDITRLRGHPSKVESHMYHTAKMDGLNVPIRYEEEGGSAGKIVTNHLRRNVLPGYNFDGIRSTGSKEARARAFSTYAKGGRVKLVVGPWNRDFVNEAEQFPNGAHDDQIDSTSGCFNRIMTGKRVRIIV